MASKRQREQEAREFMAEAWSEEERLWYPLVVRPVCFGTAALAIVGETMARVRRIEDGVVLATVGWGQAS